MVVFSAFRRLPLTEQHPCFTPLLPRGRGYKARAWGEAPSSLSPRKKRRLGAGLQELGAGNHKEANCFTF